MLEVHNIIIYIIYHLFQVDHDELEDAQWFSKQEIALMFAHKHKDNLFVPPRQALAHQLLKSWILKSRL
jgi:NAD+ diphosphatase